MKIITNNVPRDVIDAYELSETERKEFDYIDWQAVDNGESSPEFVRYKGQLIDLGDLEGGFGTAMPEVFQGWSNYRSDSFFSGILVRFVFDGETYTETVVMGRYYS